jgi:DNA-binding ferritin-like protein
VNKVKNEAIEMVKNSSVVGYTGNYTGVEEFDKQLTEEINSIDNHFRNIIDLLKQKKDSMIYEIRSSMISTRRPGKFSSNLKIENSDFMSN